MKIIDWKEAWEAGLEVLKPDKKTLEHGLELHDRSFVWDAYGFAPNGPGALDLAYMENLVRSGALRDEFVQTYEKVAKLDSLDDPEIFALVREMWRRSGVNCLFQNAGEESNSADTMMFRLGLYTALPDRYPDLFTRGVFPKAVDILLDMLCNSLFQEEEMEKERGVILEELNMVCDTPDDYIMDLLDEQVFSRTPLSKSVLGSRTNIRHLKRNDILDYIRTWYTRDNIVVSVVGNFDEERLADQLEEKLSVFGAESPAKRKVSMPAGCKYASLTRDINQTHLALGIPTIALDSPDYYVQAVVSDVLGGSMSSRLFQNIRERKGLAYSVFSASESYACGGQFYIYAAVKPETEAEVLSAIGDELTGLAAEGISERQTEVVKQRLKSGFIFSLESTNSRMVRLGKNLLLLGRTYSEEETMAEIDAVTPQQVNRFVQRIADIRRYSGAVISPHRLEWEELWNGSQNLNGSAKRS